jgi:hypothetical protein
VAEDAFQSFLAAPRSRCPAPYISGIERCSILLRSGMKNSRSCEQGYQCRAVILPQALIQFPILEIAFDLLISLVRLASEGLRFLPKKKRREKDLSVPITIRVM